MGVLDRLKAYQQLTRQPETETTPQPSTPEVSPDGETLQPGSVVLPGANGLVGQEFVKTSPQGHSFLQQFILEMLKKNNIPVQALKFIPGFGEQVNKLLFGDPYEAHTFFADMHYQVEQLLQQDSAWDPVEVVRNREFAAAEERAIARTAADYNERLRASTESSASREIDGVGSDGEREEHLTRYFAGEVHAVVSPIESPDH